jgi:hypothetical protein
VVLLTNRVPAHRSQEAPSTRSGVVVGSTLAGDGATLALDYGELNQRIARAAVTPAMFRHADVGSGVTVSGVWADWVLLAGNRRNLEMRCPILSGEASGVGAPALDLTGGWVRIHARLDKIPALGFPASARTTVPASRAGDPDADARAIAVIGTYCWSGSWSYRLPELMESWFNTRLDELQGVFSVVLADDGDGHRHGRPA